MKTNVVLPLVLILVGVVVSAVVLTAGFSNNLNSGSEVLSAQTGPSTSPREPKMEKRMDKRPTALNLSGPCQKNGFKSATYTCEAGTTGSYSGKEVCRTAENWFNYARMLCNPKPSPSTTPTGVTTGN